MHNVKENAEMESKELTLALDGEVTLKDFSQAMLRFKELINGLKDEVAPGSKINWVIDDLKKKCTITRIKGVAVDNEDIVSITQIRKAYIELGRKIVHGETLTNDYPVIQAVTGLRRLINGRITSIRFETDEKKYTIKKHTIFAPTKTYWDTETFGGARGRVQSISDRQYLHFTLFDYNDDHPITCSSLETQKEEMRNAWGKLAYIEGTVTRDKETDLISSINNITKITLIKEREPQEWRKALGCTK